MSNRWSWGFIILVTCMTEQSASEGRNLRYLRGVAQAATWDRFVLCDFLTSRPSMTIRTSPDQRCGVDTKIVELSKMDARPQQLILITHM